MDKAIQELLLSKNWKNKTILLVEDDTVTIDYIKTILFETKVNIITTKDGDDAIDIIKNNPEINLILMDIKLPKTSGIEITQKVRAINTSIPIVTQTAHAVTLNKQEVYNAGCVDIITKPFTIETLLTTISKYL